MAKKKKIERTDGLGAHEKAKLRIAIRQVWHRCLARKLTVDRCTDKDGFASCEECGKKKLPKVTIDHVDPVGEVGPGFIERMFVPSAQLRGLCKDCHRAKTNDENRKRRAAKKSSIGAESVEVLDNDESWP